MCRFAAMPDPLFPGINPEPIEPHIRALGEAVVANGCDAGLCTDGDADRIGATDEHGNFVDPHKIFSVLLSWVLRAQGLAGRGDARVQHDEDAGPHCGKYGRELIEHGIGFKYVCDLMLEREIVMGGEESGGIGFQRHLPERDGLLNCAAAGERDGGGEEDAGPAGGRSAGGVRRAPVWAHRYAHSGRGEACGDCAGARRCRRAMRLCGDADAAAGDAGWGEVLPRQSRRRDEAECCGDVAAAAGQRDGAADADLYRVVLEGVGGEAAGERAGVCDGKLNRQWISRQGSGIKAQIGRRQRVHSHLRISLERTCDRR